MRILMTQKFVRGARKLRNRIRSVSAGARLIVFPGLQRRLVFYFGITVVYEVLQAFNNYIPNLLVTFLPAGVSRWHMVQAVLMIVVFDETFMFIDRHRDYLIAAKILRPATNRLFMGAFAKLLRLPIVWHNQNNSGAVATKINRAVDKFGDLLHHVFWDFIATIVQATIALSVMAWKSWPSAVVCAAGLLCFLTISHRSYRVRRRIKNQRYQIYEWLGEAFVQYVQSIADVVGFGQARRVSGSVQEKLLRAQELGATEDRLNVFTFGQWRSRLLTLSFRMCQILWIWQLQQGYIDVLFFFYLNTLAERLGGSCWRFNQLFEVAAEAWAAIERLSRLHGASEPSHEPVVYGPFPQAVSVELQDVSFAYNGDEHTVRNVSLAIHPGEVVAIVGPSGAGKSTLAGLIQGTLKPVSGQIYISGVNITHVEANTIAYMVTTVRQDAAVFDDDFLENIRFGKPGASMDQVIAASGAAGLHEYISSLRRGYYRVVGERGMELSGGQKQRLAIARALLVEPQVLIFDESTSHLDVITEAFIQEQLDRFLMGRTAIIIAHRLSTIRKAHRIVVMDKGAVVAVGTHRDLLANSSLYQSMIANSLDGVVE